MDIKLEALLSDIFEKDNIVKIIMSDRRRKSLPCKKITLRPLTLNGETLFQCEYHYEKKVTHENLPAPSARQFVISRLKEDFRQLDILLTDRDVKVLAKKIDNVRIISRQAARCRQDMSHDRVKKHIIPDGTPCDFLVRLGVMSPAGKVHAAHYNKYRQINRYLEIISDVLGYLPDDPLRIIDFGCGKAYLTFALYHYLSGQLNRKTDIIGLDLKADVIEFCSRTAADLGYDDLKFEIGDIAGYDPKPAERAGSDSSKADLVVTLHACDTATDQALINAVKWNTRVILSVPCCQHELFSQIENPLLDPLLQHGIIKDRFTEILTDGLRGLKLEAAGYDVSMIEFTSLEHTARNIMIKAIKTRSADSRKSKKAAEQYAELCEEYHVHPAIDGLMI